MLDSLVRVTRRDVCCHFVNMKNLFFLFWLFSDFWEYPQINSHKHPTEVCNNPTRDCQPQPKRKCKWLKHILISKKSFVKKNCNSAAGTKNSNIWSEKKSLSTLKHANSASDLPRKHKRFLSGTNVAYRAERQRKGFFGPSFSPYDFLSLEEPQLMLTRHSQLDLLRALSFSLKREKNKNLRKKLKTRQKRNWPQTRRKQTISDTFDSLFRVLFIFPSRYLWAIGLPLAYLALGGTYHPFGAAISSNPTLRTSSI